MTITPSCPECDADVDIDVSVTGGRGTENFWGASVAVDADLEYRRVKARTYAEQRSQGNTSVGAEIEANAAAADARHKRDIAESLAKASLLRIQEVERESVSVRDIHSTSERIDGLAA